MDLAGIFSDRIEKELDLGKLGKLNVVYCLEAYTPEAEQKIHSAINGETKSKWLKEFLPDLIKDWDLTVTTEADAAKFGVQIGSMVPITQEAIALLPVSFLVQVFNETVGASSPNAKSSSRRETSSSTEGSEEQ